MASDWLGKVAAWRLIRLSADLAAAITATVIAFLLRFDLSLPREQVPVLLAAIVVFTFVKAAFSVVFALYRQHWMTFTFRDVWPVLGASAGFGLVGTMLVMLGASRVAIPLSVPIIDGVLTALFLLAVRAAARQSRERWGVRSRSEAKRRNVLLLGAGEAGMILAREMMRHGEMGMRPVGFLDDDATKHGRFIASVPVLGTIDDIDVIVASRQVDEVLICLPSADGRVIRSVIETLGKKAPDVPYRTMPALHELLSGQVSISRIREVGIDDLLRRPPVEIDAESILDYLHGKRIMVTGAGGSIGSELIRQICPFGPEELILFGHGENSIYQLERELDVRWPEMRYTSIIAAVQNVGRLDDIFRRNRPEVVFHTAAHKHVPLMEANPEEAVFNNVIGTRNLVNLAIDHGVSHFVNISTDKAVNPVSVMGASKRVGELVVEHASRRARSDQVFVSVRFGNVLGSRGSAVPVFKEQIRSGGPVTVTHPDMIRYFMTIPEASRLVLQASAQGRNGDIYILDMGAPIRVLDLVTDLIRLSGLEPEIDIPIIFTGVRPGEKMFEELRFDDEQADATGHEKIFVTRPRQVDAGALDTYMVALTDAAMRADAGRIRALLLKGIPGVELLA